MGDKQSDKGEKTLRGGSFSIGEQPCDNFKGAQDGNAHGIWENRHQCMTCEVGTVSFCENCSSDHHIDGWDSCSKGIKDSCEFIGKATDTDPYEIRKLLSTLIVNLLNTRTPGAIKALEDVKSEIEAKLAKTLTGCDCEYEIDPETGHHTNELIHMCFQCEMKGELEHVFDAAIEKERGEGQ